MSRDGNGVFSLVVNSWNPAVDGNAATTVDWQALIDDVAAALTQSVSSDGQTPMTGDLNMNGNRIESLAAGTSTTDAANVGQIYNQGTEQDVASAATTDIGIVNSNFIRITGTTTITSLGTNYRGPKFVRFSDALILTHNASTLILPGGANITTATGDRAIFVPKGNPSDGWNCVVYEYAGAISGNIVVNGTVSSNGQVLGQSFRNKLINSNFQINQRAVSGSVVLAAGAYGHDRWKAGASGCSYTFASSNGKVTLTISAGSLQQVIASEEVPIGTTTCVLSWEGSAQGKIGAGSYGSSGVTQSVTGGSNLTIEFNTGTLAIPQLEVGNYATAYEQKTYSEEFDNCWRYFRQYGSSSATVPIGPACGEGTTAVTARMPLSPPMRSTPTPSLASGELIFIRNGVDRTSSTIAFGGETTLGIAMELQSLSGTVTAGEGGTVAVNTNGILRLSAEI